MWFVLLTSYILAKSLVTAIDATQASNVNAFAGVLEVIADANLTGTRYYILADPGLASCSPSTAR